jgi:hypothetical protein
MKEGAGEPKAKNTWKTKHPRLWQLKGSKSAAAGFDPRSGYSADDAAAPARSAAALRSTNLTDHTEAS